MHTCDDIQNYIFSRKGCTSMYCVGLVGGGGGVLPYMGYTGMCRSTGYVFCFSDSGTGYKIRTFSLEQGIFYFRFDSGIVSNFP